MSYNQILKIFIDEMIKEGISPEKIKHLEKRRIKEIALEGLKTASKGEFSHLFFCPICKVKWAELKFKLAGKSRQKSEQKQIYSAKPSGKEKEG